MSWENHYRDVRSQKPLVWPDVNVVRQLSRLQLPTDALILDLGSGEGRNTRALLELGYTHIHVMDQSESALEIIARRYGLPAENRHCTSIPRGMDIFADAYFDAVLCWGLTHYLAVPDETLLETNRILKPGAPLVISFSAEEDRRETVDDVKTYYSREDVERLMAGAGFEIVIFGKHTDEFFTAGKIESFYWLTATKTSDRASNGVSKG